jgi:hypothetical protein
MEGAERTTSCFGSGFDEASEQSAGLRKPGLTVRTFGSDAWRHLKVEVGTLRGRSEERWLTEILKTQ